MATPRDNFFKNCPAVMDYSMMTDYRQPYQREEYIRNINAISDEYQYRAFLQKNTGKILDAEWNYMTEEYSCNANMCLHNYPTTSTNKAHAEEMKLYNAIKTGKVDPAQFKCEKKENYRMC